MPSLVVCEACSRHIRRNEAACPFCGEAVSSQVARSPERALPATRLGRAALFAFAAASVGALGCSGKSDDTGSKTQPVSDAAAGGTSNGGATSGAGGEMIAMYGSPAMGGTTSGTGGENGVGGGVMAMYGSPFPPPPVDAGPDGKAEAGSAGGHENGAGGGFMTLYGMPAK